MLANIVAALLAWKRQVNKQPNILHSITVAGHRTIITLRKTALSPKAYLNVDGIFVSTAAETEKL